MLGQGAGERRSDVARTDSTTAAWAVRSPGLPATPSPCAATRWTIGWRRSCGGTRDAGNRLPRRASTCRPSTAATTRGTSTSSRGRLATGPTTSMAAPTEAPLRLKSSAHDPMASRRGDRHPVHAEHRGPRHGEHLCLVAAGYAGTVRPHSNKQGDKCPLSARRRREVGHDLHSSGKQELLAFTGRIRLEHHHPVVNGRTYPRFAVRLL